MKLETVEGLAFGYTIISECRDPINFDLLMGDQLMYHTSSIVIQSGKYHQSILTPDSKQGENFRSNPFDYTESFLNIHK